MRDVWLVSRRFDLGILAAPFAAAALSLLTLGDRGPDLPLWAFLAVVVAFDVAHVWSTAYVTYLDGEARRRRPLLLTLTPLLAFGVSLRVLGHSMELFWTLLAYVAIYHFIRQQWGFIALYKARLGERSSLDFHLDKWTLWAGALGPVALWHASPGRQFDWFNAGESFIVEIPAAFRGDIVIVTAVFAVLWSARQVQRYAAGEGWNPGKVLWMVTSWISWQVGIGLSDDPIVSAAFINLPHGVPFLALVWHRANSRWQGRPGGGLVGWLSQRRRWLAFYGVVLALALVEELLWDGAVWRQYLPGLIDLAEVPVSALPIWVALLSVPQIVHYILDAWIWRLDGSDPGLEAMFPWRQARS